MKRFLNWIIWRAYFRVNGADQLNAYRNIGVCALRGYGPEFNTTNKDTMNEKYACNSRLPPPPEHIDVLQLRRLKVKDMRAARRASDKPEEWDEPLMAAASDRSW